VRWFPDKRVWRLGWSPPATDSARSHDVSDRARAAAGHTAALPLFGIAFGLAGLLAQSRQPDAAWQAFHAPGVIVSDSRRSEISGCRRCCARRFLGNVLMMTMMSTSGLSDFADGRLTRDFGMADVVVFGLCLPLALDRSHHQWIDTAVFRLGLG
jgi:hypothetical protein